MSFDNSFSVVGSANTFKYSSCDLASLLVCDFYSSLLASVSLSGCLFWQDEKILILTT
jgi:hypothetical protein